MKINKCRVCGQPIYAKPLLRYSNMPRMAQNLPDKASLKKERGVRLEVCQCSGCGLVQLNNEPVPYYKEVIRASAFSPAMRAFRQKQFHDFVARFFLRGKKVIEVGCGCGEYLSLMKACGAAAYGLEFSAKSVAHCVKNRLNVRRGFIDDAGVKLKGAPFAAFFMMSFLEHLSDPKALLAGIRNNLAENAVGLVEVPNFDMILQGDLFSEFIGDHLLYFSRRTLETALSLSGFTVLECRPVWHDYILSAVVQKRRPLDPAGFDRKQVRLKSQICQLLVRFHGKKIAIWGAGHQALALIALLDMAKRIRYVIDSAPFKQGKYTPATHLPIVSPDSLEKDPVDVVIVLAASYSKEVVNILARRHGKKVEIVLLGEAGFEVRHEL